MRPATGPAARTRGEPEQTGRVADRGENDRFGVDDLVAGRLGGLAAERYDQVATGRGDSSASAINVEVLPVCLGACTTKYWRTH
jgi:hypothetical protein